MKIVLAITMFIFSALSLASGVVIEDNPIAGQPKIVKRTGEFDNGGPFFLLSNGMLIINFEQLNDHDGKRFSEIRSKWLHKKSSKWKTVKIEELSPLGLKERMKFKYIEWGKDGIKEYTLKSNIHLAMIGDDFYDGSPTSLFYRTFYIVLNDSIEGINHPEFANGDKINGIAYTGEEFKLKSSKEVNGRELFSFPTVTPGNKPALEKFYSNLQKTKTAGDKISIRDLSFDQTKLFFIGKKLNTYNDEVDDTRVILQDSKNVFKDLSFLSNDHLGHIRISNFIEGADLTLLIGSESMHSCFKLIIKSKVQEYKFALMCDSGGC